MNSVIVILGTVLVVLIIYMLFKSYFDGKQTLVSQTKLDNMQEVVVVSRPTSAIFSYGIWVHIDKWPTNPTPGSIYFLFKRLTELEVYFTNNASLKIKAYDSTSDASNTDIIVTNNFPIQKWVHIGIVVDNKIMDVYLDGKMVKSVELNKPLTPSDDKIIYGKSSTSSIASDTHIAEHKRLTYAVDPQGMWDMYMEGNGIGGVNKVIGDMNVNLSILKDGVESSKISLW